MNGSRPFVLSTVGVSIGSIEDRTLDLQCLEVTLDFDYYKYVVFYQKVHDSRLCFESVHTAMGTKNKRQAISSSVTDITCSKLLSAASAVFPLP